VLGTWHILGQVLRDGIWVVGIDVCFKRSTEVKMPVTWDQKP
jgi:hypothetical protein